MSITHNRRIQLEVSCPDADAHVPSLFSVYPTTDWHERETYDFFGIVFDGHPGLTRIEMPDDWVGHPQRKDYPLGGVPVEYHGAQIPPPDERRPWAARTGTRSSHWPARPPKRRRPSASWSTWVRSTPPPTGCCG
jgi:NADH-quinone oxidoreductase subunit C